MGVCMIWIGHLEKFLEGICRLPCLMLEISLGGSDVFLVGVVYFLVIIIVAAGSNCDRWGRRFCPFLLPLAFLLAPLPVALGGGPGNRRRRSSHHPRQKQP
jgi:hypothetical protein